MSTLVEYLRDLLDRGTDLVAVPDAVDADIDRFRDVMIADGTVLRLHEFLSDEFQARHEEQAGAKLHLLHNATDQTIERIDVTDEKRTTARYSRQDRGCKDDWFCLIERTSNTAALR